jgi:hypothetical protein
MPSNLSEDITREELSQALADKYAPTAWGQPVEYDFTCPSGQICRIKQIKMEDLITGDHAGLLNDTDFLTGIVESEHNPAANRAERRAKGKKSDEVEADINVDIKKLKENPEQTKKFLAILDQIVINCIIAPKVHALPPEEVERVNGLVYVDTVNFNDRIAIFQEAMKGTGNLQQFRENATEDAVGAVETRKRVSNSAK